VEYSGDRGVLCYLGTQIALIMLRFWHGCVYLLAIYGR
jgi:hypothetical protein